MTTATLSQTLSMAADGFTESWIVKPFGAYSFEVQWAGADAVDSTVSLQISNTGDQWNCYGTDPAFTFDAANGAVMILIPESPATVYARLSFTANANTTGQLVIYTNGTPHKGFA
jgi:hypothetical protein